jgi:NAD(P)-dependent dehydrogenase (short-subunit alcohol dehydrogenase family)
MFKRRDFKNKVVVITGAAGGIGSALAVRFGAAGARLGLLDLDGDGASSLAKKLSLKGVKSRAVGVDITDEKGCRGAINEVISHLGEIDLLINNAGLTHRSAFATTEAKVYEQVMAVNFFGTLYCTQTALASLVAQKGMIIAISSIAGLAPLYGRSGYAASKHAINGLLGSLRCELQPDGVDVMIACPSFTATNFSFKALDGDGAITAHPQSTVGRVATPQAVAAAIYEGAVRCRRLLVLSPAGIASLWVSRLCPALYERLMTRSLASELKR